MAYKIVLLIAFLAAPALCQYHEESKHQVHHEPEHYPPPKYEYHYKVEDKKTGDYKEHQENRNGDVTKGFYWLIDADGYRRHVEYIVDGKSGFQAKVTREPTEHKPAPIHHAPVHHAPTPKHH